MTGILIMTNNYLHDLCTAVLLVSVLGAVWVGRKAIRAPDEAGVELWKVSRRFRLMAWLALALVLAFGYVRAVNYKEFEWNTAVQHGQVAALIVKHIVLISVTGLGIYHLVKIRREEKND